MRVNGKKRVTTHKTTDNRLPARQHSWPKRFVLIVVVVVNAVRRAYIFYLLVSRNISRADRRRRPCATAQRVENEKNPKDKIKQYIEKEQQQKDIVRRKTTANIRQNDFHLKMQYNVCAYKQY